VFSERQHLDGSKEVIEMPFGDGTGPMGLGPMTGRAAGYCAGYPVPGYMNPYPGYGYWGGPAYGYGAMPYSAVGYAPYPAFPYGGRFLPRLGRWFGRGWGMGIGRGRGIGIGRGRGRWWW